MIGLDEIHFFGQGAQTSQREHDRKDACTLADGWRRRIARIPARHVIARIRKFALSFACESISHQVKVRSHSRGPGGSCAGEKHRNSAESAPSRPLERSRSWGQGTGTDRCGEPSRVRQFQRPMEETPGSPFCIRLDAPLRPPSLPWSVARSPIGARAVPRSPFPSRPMGPSDSLRPRRLGTLLAAAMSARPHCALLCSESQLPDMTVSHRLEPNERCARCAFSQHIA